ncbi:hypothetical protein [Pontixanthobacter sp. CEM42]|uniref:hypothetical protein n=1 Tax=Pontixanthobacter sp. CEM42 TaxID=2792077 RepID=UPI001ADFBE3E|nr:hypothetical protein [Pontixanthobacter sp. CEM42]
MKIKSLVTGAMATLLLAQPVAAQSIRDLHYDDASDVRVSAGITIPFGGKSRSVETKPRFDFGFEQSAQRNEVLLARPWYTNQAQERRRMTLSLTLEDNPRMLLNQQQVARFSLSTFADEADATEKPKKGGGNTLLIIGGVLVTGYLVAAVAVTADAVDAIEDLTDPD